MAQPGTVQPGTRSGGCCSGGGSPVSHHPALSGPLQSGLSPGAGCGFFVFPPLIIRRYSALFGLS